jgi:hypothetical protein
MTSTKPPFEAGNPGIHTANYAILDHWEAFLAGSAGDPILPCSTKIDRPYNFIPVSNRHCSYISFFFKPFFIKKKKTKKKKQLRKTNLSPS